MTYSPDPNRRPVPWQVVVTLAGVILLTAVVCAAPIIARAVI